jgi:rhodanese-related sulfurtransferase
MSVSTISPVELAQLYHSGKKIELIDVRTPFEYWEVRVDFARNIPLDQLEPAKLIASQNGSASEPL